MPWEEISENVRKELRNRERFSPTISVYRWWARRSHGLIGTILDRATKVLGNEIVVSDPMSGGGTVAVEAARRGLKVYAQDINPWAAHGLKTVLQPVDPNALRSATERLITSLEKLAKKSYLTKDGAEIIHTLHVRKTKCPSCKEFVFLYPSSLLALDRRPTFSPEWGWFGCRACGGVTKDRYERKNHRCKHCRTSLTGRSVFAPISDMCVCCAHCNHSFSLTPKLLAKSTFIPILDHVKSGNGTTFIPVNENTTTLRKRATIRKSLDVEILDGLETRALIKMGFRKWVDLYPERQLRLVDGALDLIPTVTTDPAVANRLRLAIAGFSEMAGYASRWDARYRKAYEITANHHYSRVLLSAEVNPAGSMGRGTLLRRLRQASNAGLWFPGMEGAEVHNGSSEHQRLENESVDLVITDPPYFDSVQYGELAQGFLVFGAACGLPVSLRWQRNREAVPNATLGRGGKSYRELLQGIMRETSRTLKPSGRLLLTFHDKELFPWECLADALKAADLRVIGLGIVHSENETDHAKRGKSAMTSDLVIECAKDTSACDQYAQLCVKPETALQKNLAAVGYTIAKHASGSPTEFKLGFHSRLRRYKEIPLIRSA